MKSKFYWEQQDESARPFDLPRRISEGIADCRKKIEGRRSESPTVRYIWIYLTDQGLRHGHGPSPCDSTLSIDDWLNIIDESATLGAEWMMLYVGASLSQCPLVWRMCEWAQNTHQLNVGLHLSCNCLSEDDIERLTQLDKDRTYLVADASAMNGLQLLKDRGVQICQSDLHLGERMTRCTKPADIACVGPDGNMFSCGLVLGEKEFALGDARARGLGEVIADNSLPHAIDDTTRYREEGCHGCPSLVESHLHSRH